MDVTVNDPGPTASTFSLQAGDGMRVGGVTGVGPGAAAVVGDAGDSLTFSGPATSTDGALVSVGANGSFSYDPTSAAAFETLHFDATATDTFTYTVTDNHTTTSPAHVTLEFPVLHPNPTASSFTVSTGEDSVF